MPPRRSRSRAKRSRKYRTQSRSRSRRSRRQQQRSRSKSRARRASGASGASRAPQAARRFLRAGETIPPATKRMTLSSATFPHFVLCMPANQFLNLVNTLLPSCSFWQPAELNLAMKMLHTAQPRPDEVTHRMRACLARIQNSKLDLSKPVYKALPLCPTALAILGLSWAGLKSKYLKAGADFESHTRCEICFEEFSDEPARTRANQLTCMHNPLYHADCLESWFSASVANLNPGCPYCKAPRVRNRDARGDAAMNAPVDALIPAEQLDLINRWEQEFAEDMEDPEMVEFIRQLEERAAARARVADAMDQERQRRMAQELEEQRRLYLLEEQRLDAQDEELRRGFREQIAFHEARIQAARAEIAAMERAHEKWEYLSMSILLFSIALVSAVGWAYVRDTMIGGGATGRRRQIQYNMYM